MLLRFNWELSFPALGIVMAFSCENWFGKIAFVAGSLAIFFLILYIEDKYNEKKK